MIKDFSPFNRSDLSTWGFRLVVGRKGKVLIFNQLILQ
jgi:hypothetical protein